MAVLTSRCQLTQARVASCLQSCSGISLRPVCAPSGHHALPAHAFAPAPSPANWRGTGQSIVCYASSSKAAPATVKIVIQGRKLEVTEAIRSYIEDKLTKAISAFQHTLREVDVTISARGGDTGTHGKKEQKVDVTIYTLRNGVVRVEDVEDSLYAAIDLVCDKISRKLTRVKERAISKGRWPGKAGPKENIEENEYEEARREFITETRQVDEAATLSRRFDELNRSFPAEVLRTKVVELDPMTVDEAIDAMEAVGHDFFVFREMESDFVQVVYKRSSAGYGVLIPRKRE